MSTSLPTSIKDALRNLVTLRHFAPPLSGNLFFIFGCQRSGTTLLLSILNAHPQITAVDETEFPSPYPFPSAQRLAFSQLTGTHLCFKMIEHSHKLHFLTRFYPRAKILWPVRNPHSTISSMLNLTNAEGDWIDRCATSEINRLRPYFQTALGSLDLSQLSKIEQAATYWRYKNEYPEQLRKSGFEVLEFKYEDLLQNQKTTLEQILSFLDINWSDDILTFYSKNQGKSLAGGTRTDRPINAERASKLKSNLSAAEIETINNICAPIMRKQSYEMYQATV